MTTVRISAERSDVDVAFVHDVLSRRSYWAAGIPRELVERSIEGSLCFSAFDGAEQVGFARVVTDSATFAWLADVFVAESHRGRGISKLLVGAAVSHPAVARVRRWHLVTRDAHGLYERFGFRPLAHPERHMERVVPNPYAT